MNKNWEQKGKEADSENQFGSLLGGEGKIFFCFDKQNLVSESLSVFTKVNCDYVPFELYPGDKLAPVDCQSLDANVPLWIALSWCACVCVCMDSLRLSWQVTLIASLESQHLQNRDLLPLSNLTNWMAFSPQKYILIRALHLGVLLNSLFSKKSWLNLPNGDNLGWWFVQIS